MSGNDDEHDFYQSLDALYALCLNIEGIAQDSWIPISKTLSYPFEHVLTRRVTILITQMLS